MKIIKMNVTGQLDSRGADRFAARIGMSYVIAAVGLLIARSSRRFTNGVSPLQAKTKRPRRRSRSSRSRSWRTVACCVALARAPAAHPLRLLVNALLHFCSSVRRLSERLEELARRQ